MILILFSTLLTIFMFNSFTATFHIQTVNRAVIYTPIEIFEASIKIVNIEDEDNLYFDDNLLINNLQNYYSDTISSHLTNYTVSTYFYNQADGSICVSGKCNAVEVTIHGTYSYFFEYDRSITYEIHKGAKYGQ